MGGDAPPRFCTRATAHAPLAVAMFYSARQQGGDPFGSRGTTSSGAFDISALRPATGLGLERREASAAPKKAQEGEGSEFLGA